MGASAAYASVLELKKKRIFYSKNMKGR